MKNLLNYALFLFLAVSLVGCSNDDDTNTDPQTDVTIAQFVATNPDYSSLAAALDAAGLTATLDGQTELTVFAPNNAAFSAFLNDNGFASLDDVPVDVLRNTLLNHVLNGTNLSSSLTTGYVNSLAVFGQTETNLSLYINTDSGVVVNGVSQVTAPDIAASNGVIHAVDTVIAIPTVVTQATANPEFSTLVEALIAASDTNTNYVALLSGSDNSPFTVFAPTNDAFSALLATLGLSSLDDIPQELLQTVLNYHVLAGANVRAENLEEGLTAETFQGEDITISLQNGPQIIDASGMPANIIVTDVQTSNGVVHAIDKVLLPQAAIDVVDPTINGLASMTPSLSTLFEALQITGLDAVLDDRDQEFTVFAPTNDAFTSFLQANNIPSLGDVPVPVLSEILLNHVVGGTNLSTDLTTGYINTSASFGTTDANLSLYVDTTDGVLLNGQSSVSSADVPAANGVVQIVDAVIALPTVVTFATADPTFETLVAALTRDDQPDFVGVLSTPNGTSPAPFTVFAPTNDAFADLLVELGVPSLDSVDGPTLTAALNTHVIAGANVREEDLVDGTVMTLGDDVIVDATNGTLTDPNGRVSTIVVTNVQAANGVVHVINKVLLPQL
ncbi:MAG: fasciclin domain-containing protein [Marinirhabdus sp.]|nr:fasciclin domain-containing protein [Marinirhabdus sp.]